MLIEDEKNKILKADKLFSLILKEINTGLTPNDVLDKIYETFREVIPYDRMGCALIDDKNEVVTSKWNRADYQKKFILHGYSAFLNGTSLKNIVDSGNPRIINDLEEYFSKHPDSKSTQLILKEGIRSSLTCPLVSMNGPVGFLFFSSKEKETYKNEHVEIYMTIADEVSVIIEKSRLLEKNMELNELKNRFIGMAAHDLRNPLFIISSYLSMIRRGKFGNLSPKLEEKLELIHETATHMQDLVENILDVNIIESGEMKLNLELLSIAEIFNEKCGEQELFAIEKSIEIVRDFEEKIPNVMIDRSRIGQAIENLVSNALKYSYSGSKIFCCVRREDNYIKVSVQNKGQEIPEADRNKLFQNFGKTSVRPTGGEKSIGLGLAIVKKIVESHGGTVGFKSNKIENEFYFLLPCKD